MSVGKRGIAIHPVRNPPESRRLFPSALSLTPAPLHDPAEFRSSLDEHATLIAKHSASLLFLARRHCDEPELLDVFVDDLVALIGSSLSEGRADTLGMLERVELISALPRFRAIRRRLILRPQDGAFYGVVMTPQAASLRLLHVRQGPAGRAERYVLVPDSDVLIEPLRQRTKFSRRFAVTCSTTPNSWLRVDAFRRPSAPASPDAAMDRLLAFYAADVRCASWRISQISRRPAHECFATIDSSRWSGDRVDAWEGKYQDALVGDQPRIGRALDGTPDGWLGAVLRTDEHVGVRWLNIVGDPAREPAPIPAFAPFQPRLRLATSD